MNSSLDIFAIGLDDCVRDEPYLLNAHIDVEEDSHEVVERTAYRAHLAAPVFRRLPAGP